MNSFIRRLSVFSVNTCFESAFALAYDYEGQLPRWYIWETQFKRFPNRLDQYALSNLSLIPPKSEKTISSLDQAMLLDSVRFWFAASISKKEADITVLKQFVSEQL